MQEQIKQNQLELQRFDPMPVAIWLCKRFGVSDMWQIDTRQGMMEAWCLMSPEMTTLVEVGCVLNGGNAQNTIQPMSFELRNADQLGAHCGDESQRVQCLLGPAAERCKWFRSPVPSEMPHNGTPDMDRVCIYGVQSIHKWSSLPITVDVRLSWFHTGLQQLYGYDRVARALAVGGATVGSNMEVCATRHEGEDVRVFHLNPGHTGILSGEFVATTALVNESNLMNGIIELPPDVCDAARLPIYRGVPPCPPQYVPRCDDDPVEAERLRAQTQAKWAHDFEQRIKDGKLRPTLTFYAIPINHVLAWPLRDPLYLTQHKMQVETLQFRPPPDNPLGLSPEQPVLLYFLLADGFMPALVTHYRNTIMRGVDMRPLHQAGFDFVPRTERTQYGADIPENAQRVHGVMSVRAFLTYRVAPQISAEQLSKLIPTLSPGFPSCSQWLSERQRIDAALQAYDKNQ